MDTPNASKTQAKSICSLLEAVTEATTTDPRPLTEVCSRMLPMAVMDSCSPMGSPMPSSRAMWSSRGRRSSRDRCSRGKRFQINTRQATPDNAWEITVAQAAPATPMGMTRMRNRSRPMLSTEAITKNTTGVRLSPRARKRLARVLYSTVTGMPRKMTTM